jgi:hypothetical protein
MGDDKIVKRFGFKVTGIEKCGRCHGTLDHRQQRAAQPGR